MAALTLPPPTLPVATRAWSVPDGAKPVGRPSFVKRPSRFIALDVSVAGSAIQTMPGFDDARWAPEGQPFVVGNAVIGRTYNWAIEREIIFYPDELPESGKAVLRQYVDEHTYRRGARPQTESDPEPDLIWRDEHRITVELLSLNKFLKRLYYVGYKDRGLFIAYALPWVLSRLATEWDEVVKGPNAGAWQLTLWTYRDPVTGEERPSAGWRPLVILKRVTPDVVFTEFSSCRGDKGEKGSRYKGQFFDPTNQLNGLTGRHWTLAEALRTFNGETLDDRGGSPVLDSVAIDQCRKRLRATVSLTQTLIKLFDDLHPVSRGSRGYAA